MTNTWKYHIQVFKRCLAIAFHFFSDHIYYYNHAGRGTEQPLYVTYSQSLSMRGMKEQSVTLQRGQNTQNSQCKLLDSTQRDEMCNKFQGIVFIPSSSPVPTCATVQKQGLAHRLSEQPEPAAGLQLWIWKDFWSMQQTQGSGEGEWQQTCSHKHYIQAACRSPARSSHSCGLLHLTVLHAETPPAPFTRATEDQMVEIWNVHVTSIDFNLSFFEGWNRIENAGAWKEILQQNQIVQNMVQGNDFGSTTSSDSIFTTASGWSACETLCSMPTPARRPLSKSAQSPLKPTNHQVTRLTHWPYKYHQLFKEESSSLQNESWNRWDGALGSPKPMVNKPSYPSGSPRVAASRKTDPASAARLLY